MTTKTCTKCGATKPLTEFYKHQFGADGLASACKACHNADRKAHYHASKPKPKSKPSTDRVPNSSGCFVPVLLPHTAATGAPTYTPLKASDLPQPVLRPGALDHEKYGSLQPDGSVRPYTNTVHGCVGFLKDTTSNARG